MIPVPCAWTQAARFGRLAFLALPVGKTVYFVRSLCLGLLLLVVGAASAQSNPYMGEVPVTDQSDGQRAEGLKNALAQVVMKLTGDTGVLANSDVAKAVGDADRYVQQYSYRQSAVTENGQSPVKLSLVAQFDRAAVDRLLRDYGLTARSASRPALVAWLALDEGSGPHLLGENEARGLLRDAQNRGVNLVLPTLNEPGQAGLAAQAVWQSDYAMLSASYQAGLMLVGQVRRLGERWAARWTLVDSGVPQTWDVSGTMLDGVLSAGASGAAERLAGRYASATLERKITSARVWVGNLSSALDYAHLLEALSRDSLVRESQPAEARGDGVLLNLTLNVALDGWLANLPGDGLLRVVNAKPPLDGIEATLSFAR